MLNVAVATYETEFDMKLKANATAKNLFDTIVATTGIREVKNASSQCLILFLSKFIWQCQWRQEFIVSFDGRKSPSNNYFNIWAYK